MITVEQESNTLTSIYIKSVYVIESNGKDNCASSLNNQGLTSR
jgi:hypothetical protein